MEKSRCAWVTKDPLYIRYHDEEWGQLDRFTDDDYLFEMLTLEGAQAGLSWLTILKRREHYREAFLHFRPEAVAAMGAADVEKLMQNEGLIRNRRKITSTIQNAACVLEVQQEYGSFHAFLWAFMGEKQLTNHWQDESEVPAKTELSEQLSKTLKKRGFAFVGPVICYSFLQAVGLIQDHTVDCFLGKR